MPQQGVCKHAAHGLARGLRRKRHRVWIFVKKVKGARHERVSARRVSFLPRVADSLCAGSVRARVDGRATSARLATPTRAGPAGSATREPSSGSRAGPPTTAKKRRMGTRRFHVTAPRKARAAFSERSPATRTLTTRALPEAREASRGRAGETVRLARAGAPRLRVCGGSAEAKEKLRHARESTTLPAEEFHVGRPERNLDCAIERSALIGGERRA